MWKLNKSKLCTPKKHLFLGQTCKIKVHSNTQPTFFHHKAFIFHYETKIIQNSQFQVGESVQNAQTSSDLDSTEKLEEGLENSSWLFDKDGEWNLKEAAGMFPEKKKRLSCKPINLRAIRCPVCLQGQ